MNGKQEANSWDIDRKRNCLKTGVAKKHTVDVEEPVKFENEFPALVGYLLSMRSVRQSGFAVWMVQWWSSDYERREDGGGVLGGASANPERSQSLSVVEEEWSKGSESKGETQDSMEGRSALVCKHMAVIKEKSPRTAGV